MPAIFEYAKQRYIQLKGQESYDKLYNKINRSDALTQLCGLSIRKGINSAVRPRSARYRFRPCFCKDERQVLCAAEKEPGTVIAPGQLI